MNVKCQLELRQRQLQEFVDFVILNTILSAKYDQNNHLSKKARKSCLVVFYSKFCQFIFSNELQRNEHCREILGQREKPLLRCVRCFQWCGQICLLRISLLYQRFSHRISFRPVMSVCLYILSHNVYFASFRELNHLLRMTSINFPHQQLLRCHPHADSFPPSFLLSK